MPGEGAYTTRLSHQHSLLYRRGRVLREIGVAMKVKAFGYVPGAIEGTGRSPGVQVGSPGGSHKLTKNLYCNMDSIGSPVGSPKEKRLRQKAVTP
jgi:hypothetical protein